MVGDLDGERGDGGRLDVPTDALTPAIRRRRTGPAPAGKSNIRDVAKVAGVSVATVSRVIAGSDQVSPATRARVSAAIAELGFVANIHARALGGHGVPILALVVDEIFGPSFSILARGVEQVATAQRHMFVMSTTHDRPEREAEVVDLLEQQRPAAVLWLGPLNDDLDQERRVAGYAELLTSVGSRLVVCARSPLRPAPEISCVDYDNTGGARAITEHLIDLGHRDILFVGARPHHLSSQRRLEGYLAAMRNAGLPTPPQLHPPGDFTAESGRRAVREALRTGVQFTAVAAVVDSVALGVIHELNAAGLRIPQDISVTGFDDVDALPGLDVGLTSAHAPFEQVGEVAALMALDPSASQSFHQRLPVTVRVRNTSTQPSPRTQGSRGEATAR